MVAVKNGVRMAAGGCGPVRAGVRAGQVPLRPQGGIRTAGPLPACRRALRRSLEPEMAKGAGAAGCGWRREGGFSGGGTFSDGGPVAA
jgi:hypothetical protein